MEEKPNKMSSSLMLQAKQLTIILWGKDISHPAKLLTNQNKPQLSFPSTPSFDELNNLDFAVSPDSSSDGESDQELHEVSVSGICQLETVSACMVCNKIIDKAGSKLGQWPACDASQNCLRTINKQQN